MRFDFALSATEGAAAPATTSFALTLQEGERGELLVGKNVAVATGGPGNASVRQDVGTRIHAQFHRVDEDVVLELSVELSAQEAGGTIRKIVFKGNGYPAMGKATPVMNVEEDKRRYQLTVTPTKVR